MKEVTDRLIEQRVRNHLIRYFEMACNERELREYQENVPIADVLAELINQFEENFDSSYIKDGWYTQPVYSEEEIKATQRFQELWGMVDLLPDHIESIEEFLSSDHWPPFKAETKRAPDVFMKRGFLSDEEPENLTSR